MEALQDMESKDKVLIKTNKYQTPVTQELLDSLPPEVAEQLMDCLTNIEFVKRLISPDRLYYKDLPRDERGAAIVDITNPPILEDADYFRQAAIHYQKHGCYTFLRPNSNPNSEYRKFWDEERRRCWEGLIRESDGAWVSGQEYWFLNYNPMMVNIIDEHSKRADRVESFPFFFEGINWRFTYINQARSIGKHAIELAKRGAHPYFQKVYTPEGVKEWGDIKVGDRLFGTYGNITTVTDIPFDGLAGTYKVTLKDNRVIYASAEHLWLVGTNACRRIGIKTTEEMYNDSNFRLKSGLFKYAIPCNNGVNYSYQEVPIEPYTFGVLLGDATFKHTGLELAQSKEDLNDIKQYIPYEICSVDRSDIHYSVKIPNWRNILRKLSLLNVGSEDKFIPDIYKYNTREVRLNILKGLMDTDGWCSKNRSPQFCTISKKLKDDIIWVANSLGYRTYCIVKKSGYKKDGNYVQCKDSYIVTICGKGELFNLNRKINIANSNHKTFKEFLSIKSINYIGKSRCKCVSVDSLDGCYLIGDFVTTHNCAKSYSLSSIMTHNLILGESEKNHKRVMTVLCAYQKEYLKDDKDGTLSKFRPSFNFIVSNTPFPKLLLKNSPNEMSWQMGYKDEYGRDKGSLNTVMAVAIKDDRAKLRGKRGFFLFEEMGSMPGLLEVYDVCRRSVEDGGYAFGQMYLVGTAAEDESDFSSAKTLLYSPEGYNIHSITNVYDRPKQGKPTFGYFFPSYLNRAGCYNKDGVSDVVKALIEILLQRHKAKYSADPKSVLRVIAEDPITPAEAIIKVKAAFFPVTALTERLQQLDTDVHSFDDAYIGKLAMNKSGEVEFKPTSDEPIRKYGVENDTPGAIEIFELPEKDRSGKVPNTRYIIGHDPVDNDQAESSSLSSTFVLDLWTDKIVAEYTGRQAFAEDNFEIVRLLCLFYNAKCLYEAHPYSQLVYTPDGIKTWKDIRIGDRLFSPTRGEVVVTDIPVDKEMPIYKIVLEDGRVVEASDNHIWLVYKGTSKVPTEMTTIQMLQSGVKTKWNQSKFFLPEHNGVEYNYKELPIDPYTMGLILSEGSIRGNHCFKNGIQISSSDEDMKFYSNNIPYKVRHIGNRGVSWHIYIQNCKDIMMDYNLYDTDSHTKFIPDDYLYSNRVQRMELLKGLMDGDGCAKTGGASIFITCSEKLANNVLSLSRSLGIKSWLQPSREGVYRVALASIHKIFKLPRKIVEQHIYSPYSKGSKASAILNKTAIKSIEYSHTEMGKCVTVNSDDGLYLIGDYIVTHNCNKKGIYAYFAKMNCTHLLADTPEYLRDKQMIKYSSFGSNQKGVNATAAINNYANGLIRDWLMKPVTMITTIDGVEQEVVTQNLFFLRNRALIEELIAFNPEINVDRIRALGMVMLYREEKMVLYQGNPSRDKDTTTKDYIGNDPFFTNNYDKRFKKPVNLVKDVITS